MFTSKFYYDLTSVGKKQFLDFLEEVSLEKDQPAYINMMKDNSKNTLIYILDNTDRFKINGMFQVLYNGTDIVGCSGAYQSTFSSDICILGVRTWVKKNFRNKNISREYLLPNEKTWAKKQDYKCIVLSFNDYNQNLLYLWFRSRLGKKIPKREPHHFGYNGVNKVDFLVNIQYTPQWIIYENLDPTFKFNWSSIRY